MKWLAAFILMTSSAYAGDAAPDQAGDLNPEEMTLNYFADKYDFKAGKSTACIYGYWATKSGDHATGAKIFRKCADAQVDAAMVWMSYMSENGYGTSRSARDAAAWDKMAADRGYKVGEYNYGLSLMRGHGVAQDEQAGKTWIGKAAAQGDASAKELIDSGYNLDIAVPDADEPKSW